MLFLNTFFSWFCEFECNLSLLVRILHSNSSLLFRVLLEMPLIHKNSINIFLQKLPILLHSNCFLQGKIAKARQCINRAIFEEKYFLKFYDVFSSWESTWSIKWVCEGCNTAEIFKNFKCQILTSLCLVSHTTYRNYMRINRIKLIIL